MQLNGLTSIQAQQEKEQGNINLIPEQSDRYGHIYGDQRLCCIPCRICVCANVFQRKKPGDPDVRIDAFHSFNLHQLPDLPTAFRHRTQGHADRRYLCICKSWHRRHVLYPTQLLPLHSEGNGGGGHDGRLRLYQHLFQNHCADRKAGSCHSRDHGVFE